MDSEASETCSLLSLKELQLLLKFGTCLDLNQEVSILLLEGG